MIHTTHGQYVLPIPYKFKWRVGTWLSIVKKCMMYSYRHRYCSRNCIQGHLKALGQLLNGSSSLDAYSMRVISVFNYLISIIILWDGRVECRICKWKLLSVYMTFVAASVQLTSFRDVESSFSYIAPTN